jgi:hypothetical protein
MTLSRVRAFDPTTSFGEINNMDELQHELDRLLGELAELDRCYACNGDDGGNISLVIIARRGTRTAIAEVKRLMAQKSQLH